MTTCAAVTEDFAELEPLLLAFASVNRLGFQKRFMQVLESPDFAKLRP
jgi:hypothetical protein